MAIQVSNNYDERKLKSLLLSCTSCSSKVWCSFITGVSLLHSTDLEHSFLSSKKVPMEGVASDTDSGVKDPQFLIVIAHTHTPPHIHTYIHTHPHVHTYTHTQHTLSHTLAYPFTLSHTIVYTYMHSH